MQVGCTLHVYPTTPSTPGLLPREVILDHHLLQPGRDAAAARARRGGQVICPWELPTARGAQCRVDVPQDSRQGPQFGYDALWTHEEADVTCWGHLERPRELAAAMVV